MEEYKAKFIDFLLKTGALKVFENPSDDRTLKSKRISPWFVNIGDFNDGESSNTLAGFYADAVISSGIEANVLYGIPDKGVGLAAPIAMAMAAKGHNVGWFFSRKDEKTHGEATNLGPEDRIKKLTVGRAPKVNDSIVQLDDVFTAGDAKYEANAFMKSLGRTNLPLLAIAVDRQEVAIDSREAIAEYQEKTGTKVVSIVNAVDVYNVLKEGNLAPQKALERLANYIRVYGTKDARVAMGIGLEQKVIGRDRSVIPACDVETLEQFEELVKQTADVDGIGGYKIGFELGLGFGLPAVVAAVRKHTDKPIIYDHQKAGTDIPDTGKNYAKLMKRSGVDTVIFFPQAGPETERAWIYHALDNGLNVIVGGRMTHPAYAVSEGGFITDEGALDMYRIAARAGVNNFVVPGNKPDVIEQIREAVEAEGVSPIFYAPGFIAQGGKIESAAKVAGDRFHGIVGRGIYQAKNMHAAAIEHTSQL
ncbi:MAG: orotidine 5'-phosphate decarboxylase / HUMPS family protein [Nanoarchaeota archaeon]|nr:orotidine 5'-phosphate decarboxylase / HUMPS family protein [Nanoarchaeota archaeon]